MDKPNKRKAYSLRNCSFSEATIRSYCQRSVFKNLSRYNLFIRLRHFLSLRNFIADYQRFQIIRERKGDARETRGGAITKSGKISNVVALQEAELFNKSYPEEVSDLIH